MLLALAVGALLLEGAITDWSALLVARDPDAGAGVGASAVSVSNLTMAVSRTSGHRLATAIGVPTRSRHGARCRPGPGPGRGVGDAEVGCHRHRHGGEVLRAAGAVGRLPVDAGTDAARGDGEDPHRRPRVAALVRPFPPDGRPPVSRG